MGTKLYMTISGGIFGVVAAVHIMRLIYHWPVHVAEFAIPYWLSWLGVGLAGSLSVWAFRQALK